MALVEQRESCVPVVVACQALGLSRATLYRARRPAPPPPVPSKPRPSPARRLSDEERQRILDILHSPEFADQPPAEVYATLLSRGEYTGSIRTMYRVLAEVGEVRERRNVRAAQTHPTPSLLATAPNQVWTWDITKLATTEKGIFLQAYVIIDLFSRFVVGWLLATKECKHLAATLFAEAIARHGVEPGLIVHADRGSAMKSDTVAQLLADLGASRSFSRPRVSDDNAFSEAQFKTMKYQPDYPGRFTGVEHGRGWLQEFFGWHNDEHHHAGLALFTPADVFHGRVEEVAAARQHALDAAYASHPERFPKGPPVARLPPSKVEINPVSGSTNTATDVDTRAMPTRSGDSNLAEHATCSLAGDAPRRDSTALPVDLAPSRVAPHPSAVSTADRTSEPSARAPTMAGSHAAAASSKELSNEATALPRACAIHAHNNVAAAADRLGREPTRRAFAGARPDASRRVTRNDAHDASASPGSPAIAAGVTETGDSPSSIGREQPSRVRAQARDTAAPPRPLRGNRAGAPGPLPS